MLSDKLRQLRQQRPVTVIGSAVIDVIADAYALPWRGCDIELRQQSVAGTLACFADCQAGQRRRVVFQ